jgi:hypothetical protein
MINKGTGRGGVRIPDVADRLKVWESEIRAALEPGESPVVAVSCHAAIGADHLERSPDEIAHLLRFLPRALREEFLTASQSGPVPRSRWEKMLERGLDALTADALVNVDIDKLIGVSAGGKSGSCAHRLSAALDRRIGYCVVTDQRLVVAEHRLSDNAFVALASLPRQAVLQARRDGRIMRRGRVILDFIDLSQLALMTGILFAGSADRLVASLTGGMIRGDD